MHSGDDLVICLDDFNGHVDRHIDRFEGFQGRYGVGQRNSGRKCYKSIAWKNNVVKYMALKRIKEEGDIQPGRK